jgi:hypothetical protein
MWVRNGMLYDATSDTLPVCEAELTVKLSRAKIPAETLHDIVLSLIHFEVSKEDASLEAFEEYDLRLPSRDPDDWQPKQPKDFPIINKLIEPEDEK